MARLSSTGMDEGTRFGYVAAPRMRGTSASGGRRLPGDKVIIDVLYDLTGTTTDLDITGDAIGRIKPLPGDPE